MPAGPRVWQCASAATPASFFFAWGVKLAPAVPVELTSDRDARLARRLRAGWRRSAAGGAIDVDSVLAIAKRPGRPPSLDKDEDDDLDDSMLRVSITALFDRTRRESDPGRYVDPLATPFLALSTRRVFRATGVQLGDFASAMNPITGRVVHAIIGDARDVPGAEPSPFLADQLGLEPIDTAVYLVHPGTGRGQGTIPCDDEIRRQGERLYRAAEWPAVLAEFVAIMEPPRRKDAKDEEDFFRR
jgi:hypothetical protein